MLGFTWWHHLWFKYYMSQNAVGNKPQSSRVSVYSAAKQTNVVLMKMWADNQTFSVMQWENTVWHEAAHITGSFKHRRMQGERIVETLGNVQSVACNSSSQLTVAPSLLLPYPPAISKTDPLWDISCISCDCFMKAAPSFHRITLSISMRRMCFAPTIKFVADISEKILQKIMH